MLREYWFLTLLAACWVVSLAAQDPRFITPFERDTLQSATPAETHEWFQELARVYPEVSAAPCGMSDGMRTIMEVIIGSPGLHSPAAARAAGRTIVFINNAIHAGEPCGVDASMLLARRLVSDPEWRSLLDHLVLVIIPFYNVDGGEDRRPTYRANQIGPALQGFRGTDRYLDLNRDFIKADSRNTLVFTRLFRRWDPDLFVDTHTSNGADYQHTLTLIHTLPDKLPEALSAFQLKHLLQSLYAGMIEAGWPMAPYVHGDNPPEEGLHAFLDLPRYSTGYAALFQTLGFMTEAHMLKPFADRVRATEAFLGLLLRQAADKGRELQEARKSARIQARQQEHWPLRWVLDTSRVDSFLFLGYEAGYKPGPLSGRDRLFYDRGRPWQRRIPFHAHYRPTRKVTRPQAYILPQAWTEVLSRLGWQDLVHYRLERDLETELTVYRIRGDMPPARSYEGRYPHRELQVEAGTESVRLRVGDVLLPADQDGVAYLIHALEPESTDGFAAWNFFDAVLQQKEYFSAYVFEDLAQTWLDAHPEIKADFEAACREDAALAADPRARLEWIYRRSPWYEPGHRRYPVYRLEAPHPDLPGYTGP
jgi:hypothetical protein